MFLTLLGSSGGNKTWVKVGGLWRQSILWIKISGVWRQSTPKIKIAGTWR